MAEVNGHNILVPGTLRATLKVRFKETLAQTACAAGTFGPLHVSEETVSLMTVTEPSVNITCRPKKSPLSPSEYFDALNLVDRAELTSENLVLMGPEVVLTFSRSK